MGHVVNKDIRKTISFLVISIFLLLQILPYLPVSVQNSPLLSTLRGTSLFNPPSIDAAGISSASATLSNPRLSYLANVNATFTAGTQIITISGAGPDATTNHLFPGDVVGLGTATGVQNPNLRVGTIIDSTNFALKDPLISTITNTDKVFATQSGTLTVAFYTANAIPVGGSIQVQIPASTGAVSGSNNDGVPDTATATNNGFDNNKMTASNIVCPGGGFTAGTPTQAAGYLTYFCNWNGGIIPSGANLTMTIGNPGTVGGKGLVNPGPLSSGHSPGTADIYAVHVSTYTGANGTGSVIDDNPSLRVAPIEGVLVSATVDETLTFVIAAVAAGANTYCGEAHTAGITTTPTSVAWGTLTGATYTIDKNEAVQQLTVTTNAPSGYTVYGEENDQMGKDGVACPGSAGANSDDPTSGEFTFGTSTCIRDMKTGVNNALTDWLLTPTLYGFGFAEQNQSGSDAGTNLYTTGGKAYGARPFTDVSNTSENKYAANAQIMSNTGAVSGSSVYICYRIYVPGTQPAGYYYNKVKYTAVPKF